LNDVGELRRGNLADQGAALAHDGKARFCPCSLDLARFAQDVSFASGSSSMAVLFGGGRAGLI